MLVADRVAYRVDGRPLLEEISLSVERGQLVGLVGPNGAGKTTLIRLLGGAIRPTQGSMRIQGEEAQRLSRQTLARIVATVPQLTELSFDLTAGEFALLGRHPHLGRFQLEGRSDVDVAERSLAATGTGSFAGRSVLTLSGGERQCVYLARGLAQEPVALLVDEPTANLDLANQVRVMALLRSLARDQGLAVVAASHDLGLVGRYADRLVLLAEGRVVADGSPAEVITSAHIEEAFGICAQVFTDGATGFLAVVPSPEPIVHGAKRDGIASGDLEANRPRSRE